MFTDPEKNLRAFGLRESDIVADLGAGTGFYSVAAGRMVPAGKVYAIEVQKDFLTIIRNKLRDAHLNNVECLWGNIEKLGGTKIRDGIVDRAIASNVLFQVENRDKFIEEIKRIMKKGGRMLLIDWADNDSGMSSHLRTIVSKEKAREMFEKAGFLWENDIPAGAHHYGMIFRK